MVILYRIFLSLISVMGCIFFIACSKQLEVTEEIENPDSPLLTILMKESDFSSDWQWLAKYTHQKSENPTFENSYIVERASQSLAGFYGSQKHYIKIVHFVRLREEPVSIASINLSDDSFFPKGQLFTINIIPLEYPLKYKCVREIAKKEFTSTMCQLVVGYEHFISEIVIYTSTEVDTQIIETIINEVLIGIAGRLG
jgi:hypothetical protein